MRPSSGGPAEDFARRQLELWEPLGREVLNAGTEADFEFFGQALVQASLGDLPDRSGRSPGPCP